MKTLQHRFVEFIPEQVEEGILYISINYCTTIHKCICGCGNEVVTPLSPTDWKLTFDGRTISLDPSIGNWNFECQSHYWITNSKVELAGSWTKEEIFKGRHRDKKRKKAYFDESATMGAEKELPPIPNKASSLWNKILSLLGQL